MTLTIQKANWITASFTNLHGRWGEGRRFFWSRFSDKHNSWLDKYDWGIAADAINNTLHKMR
ncbi:MAG: hypothetical protein NWQ54_12405 [Paraglaciecola sp.]|uniref:hypothetical protein n=1 Tax=Paraglaciecola sp. TaxID=1920173 RepID=UPI00273D6C2F|nr:hypothetical protein [Paraglaciecola sp.]MDP5033102.1 hypothetical protein [Paraglaciecola sp.]MDP5131682.1 hypothetical protein [Paraglaciecola sp.]